MLHISWNPKVHYRVHKSPPPVSILSQLDIVYSLTPYLWTIHSDLRPQSCPLTASQHSVFSRNTAHRSHFSRSRASVMIFVTRHCRLFCSSKMLRARFNRICRQGFEVTRGSSLTNNLYLQVSESGDFATLFFLVRQHGGAEAAIAILLPTLKRFSCNVAVDWSTTCFCCERVLQKNGDSFVVAQREFRIEFGIHRNRVVPSAHAIKTWVRNFEVTGSTLKKRGGSVKTVCTPENIAVVIEAIERKSTPSCASPLLCHTGCMKQAFDGFYAKMFTSTPTKFKLLSHYINVIT